MVPERQSVGWQTVSESSEKYFKSLMVEMDLEDCPFSSSRWKPWIWTFATFPGNAARWEGYHDRDSVTLLPNQKKPARPWINLDFCCCCSSSLGNWSSVSMLEGVSRCCWSVCIQHTPKWLCVHYTVIIKNLCKEYRKDAWTVDEKTERARNERQHFGGFLISSG